MNKIALFPVQKSNAAFVRHYDLLQSQSVIPILAPAQAAMDGKDLAALDGGSKTGIVLRADFRKAIEGCELLYLDDSRFLFRDESYDEYIKIAGENKIPVMYSRTLRERLGLSKENQGSSEEWETLTDSGAETLIHIDVPVICVFTLGNEQDQGNVEMGLRRFFLNKDYRVSQIGTQEYSRLFGCHPVPEFLFEDIGGKRKRLMFNRFLRKIVKEEKPDLLIIGVPEAIMKYNNNILNGMGDVPCIMQDAVSGDIGIICTCHNSYKEEYFKELSLFSRYRLNCEANYFNISNSMVICDDDYQNRLELLPLDSEFVMEHMDYGLTPGSNFTVFNSYTESSANEAFQKMEDELTGNCEILQGGA